MDGSDFIIREYHVPNPVAPGVDFTVTLDGNGTYQCNCYLWHESEPCVHIAEVEAGLWKSDDPLIRAMDSNRRAHRRDKLQRVHDWQPVGTILATPGLAWRKGAA